MGTVSLQYFLNNIREQDPLKQGLKHCHVTLIVALLVQIREQDPLKQGLKPCVANTIGKIYK